MTAQVLMPVWSIRGALRQGSRTMGKALPRALYIRPTSMKRNNDPPALSVRWPTPLLLGMTADFSDRDQKTRAAAAKSFHMIDKYVVAGKL